jgi:putative adhesin
MKIASIAAIAFITSVGARAQQEPKQVQQGSGQQLIVPLSDPGKPCKLHVNALNGSIKVIGYEGKEVVVDVETEKNHESSNSGGMRRIGGGGAEVTAQEDGNTVTVSAGLSHVKLITVKVPQNTAQVKLSTVNDGNITATNVSGDLEVDNVNGWIHLDQISGSAVANTVNGDVIVVFKTIDPKAAMAFSTLNGKVDVTFPGDLKAKVKLKAEQGDIFSDFDVEVDKGHSNIEKNAEDHMYRINIDGWVYGSINGGGPEMMMKTTNGSVYLRKTK